MLPFFRKIRWRLAQDNRFLKYSRYAVGEIVLVVIGILIALYINNWNEQRKEEAMIQEILEEIVQDLNADIDAFNRGIDLYKEAIVWDIWGLERTSYVEEQIDSIYNYLSPSAFDYIIVNRGFDKLKNSGILEYYDHHQAVQKLTTYYTVQLNYYNRWINWDLKGNDLSTSWMVSPDNKRERGIGGFPTIHSEQEKIQLLFEEILTPHFRNLKRFEYWRRKELLRELETMRNSALETKQSIEQSLKPK